MSRLDEYRKGYLQGGSVSDETKPDDYALALGQRAAQQEAEWQSRLSAMQQVDEARRAAKAARAARRASEFPAAQARAMARLRALAETAETETERELLDSALRCVKGMR